MISVESGWTTSWPRNLGDNPIHHPLPDLAAIRNQERAPPSYCHEKNAWIFGVAQEKASKWENHHETLHDIVIDRPPATHVTVTRTRVTVRILLVISFDRPPGISMPLTIMTRNQEIITKHLRHIVADRPPANFRWSTRMPRNQESTTKHQNILSSIDRPLFWLH